jgi:taurine dioxygenase
MNFQTLKPFGCAAINCQITNLAAGDISELKTNLAHEGFVVFQNQTANDQEFVDFLKKLGPLTFTVGESPVKDHPDLNIVSSIGRLIPPKSVFHTDTSYVANPPAYTALRAVIVPEPDGGMFYFSNQYLAFEKLPATVKKQLATAKVLHVVSGLNLAEDEESECWHPLFKTHPVSGRKALFLSTPQRCQAITGVDAPTAQRIMQALYRYSIRHHQVYEHPWKSGDILLWDNRCTMHRAETVQTVGDRLLHRGLVLDSVN